MSSEIRTRRTNIALRCGFIIALALTVSSCAGKNPFTGTIYGEVPAPTVTVTANAEPPPAEDVTALCAQYNTSVVECTAQIMSSPSRPGWSSVYDSCMAGQQFPTKPDACMRGSTGKMFLKAPG
jgi:hypothetical protein